MSNHFLTEDLEKARLFGEFIFDKAKWDLKTGEAFQLQKHFAWYTALNKKIESHIFELQKVINAPSPETTEAVQQESKSKGKSK